MNREERDIHYHEKGKRDAEEDRGNNPPWEYPPVFEELMPRSDSDIADNKAYAKGRHEAQIRERARKS